MQGPNFDAFKQEILWAGEEDVTGVYEAWWRANTLYPAEPLSVRLAYAERAVRELAAEGLIILCRGTWETAADSPIPVSEHDSVLREWETWAIPEGPRIFFVAAHD
jgi:hypothetical protein